MKKQVFNPFLPLWEYVPDGEPHVFGKRVYLFGSHDRAGGDKFCMNDYVCWSAPVNDLKSWRCEGTIYKKEQDPLNADGSHMLFAPDVCRGADGRYYLYYALDFVSVISVAVCDTPSGKYEFYGHVRFSDGHVLSSRAGEPYAFDPAILRDEGKNYLYTGYCPYPPRHLMEVPKTYTYAWVYRLADDMLTIVGEPKKIAPSFSNSAGTGFEGHEFFEASSIRKVGDKYCFIWSSYYGHELCYALSQSPEGPFRFGGTIISNGDIGMGDIKDESDCNNYIGNNHGSIENINGKWYVFYHRHTNRNSFSRQACAEHIRFEGGKFFQAELTSCGLNGGPLRGEGEYPARIACHLYSRNGTYFYGVIKRPRGAHPYFTQTGGDREERDDQYIANFCDGATAVFRYFDIEGVRRVCVTLRGRARGIVEVYDKEGLAAKIPADVRGEGTFGAEYSGKAGVTSLRFVFRGKGRPDFLSFTIEK